MAVFKGNCEKFSDEERQARVKSAIIWLQEQADGSLYPETYENRWSVLSMYYHRNLRLAEKFIVDGDNFLESGWIDPFKE